MVQFSVRPPNADYLGFEATTEGIVATAKMACVSWIPACAGMTRGSRNWQCIYEMDI